MKHNRIHIAAGLATICGTATQAYSQREPVDLLTEPTSVMQEKIIDPSELLVEPAAEPAWSGEKLVASENHPNQSALPAPTLADEMLNAFRPVARAAFSLSDASVQEARMAVINDETRVAVKIDEVERIIRLYPHSMRAHDARLMVDIGGGLLVDTPWPEPATYRGSVEGMNADVAASIQDGKISMLILPRNPEESSWHMQPLSDAVVGMPQNLHVVYKSTDVIPHEGTCGVDDGHRVFQLDGNEPARVQPGIVPLAERVQQRAQRDGIRQAETTVNHDADGGTEGGSPEAANVRADLGMDADVEFYQANGSSITATVYDMELVMNQVGLIYQNQVAISYRYVMTIVRTVEPDPYTSTNPTTLLCQFGEWWNGNVSAIRDVAHLFTGKDLDGTTVGLAWIGSICVTNFNNCNASGSNLSYGLVQSRFSTNMNARVQDSAHELGHNWNACHCNTGGNCGGGTSNPTCGIMTASISGQLTFDSAAVTAITTYRDGRTCLEAWQNPTYVNWAYNGVETGSFAQPWNTMLEGVNGAMYGGEIRAQAGNYLQNIFINKIVTIRAENGTVRIGN